MCFDQSNEQKQPIKPMISPQFLASFCEVSFDLCGNCTINHIKQRLLLRLVKFRSQKEVAFFLVESMINKEDLLQQ